MGGAHAPAQRARRERRSYGEVAEGPRGTDGLRGGAGQRARARRSATSSYQTGVRAWRRPCGSIRSARTVRGSHVPRGPRGTRRPVPLGARSRTRETAAGDLDQLERTGDSACVNGLDRGRRIRVELNELGIKCRPHLPGGGTGEDRVRTRAISAGTSADRSRLHVEARSRDEQGRRPRASMSATAARASCWNRANDHPRSDSATRSGWCATKARLSGVGLGGAMSRPVELNGVDGDDLDVAEAAATRGSRAPNSRIAVGRRSRDAAGTQGGVTGMRNADRSAARRAPRRRSRAASCGAA